MDSDPDAFPRVTKYDSQAQVRLGFAYGKLAEWQNHDVLWMDEILHHLAIPERRIPP